MADPLPIAYLNGEFLPLREARVSPLDRAFLYGDAVYEVAPVYAGRVFRFTEHFDRLDRSLREIRMAPPYERARWVEVCQELVRRNGGGDMYIYVQVSRGTQFGRHHAPLPDIERTIFAFAAPPVISAPEKIEHGVEAVTAPDTRWSRRDVKSTSLLANVLLKQLAVDAGAHETILLEGGQLREGSSTTVHVVIGGEIRTPPRSEQILPGTTKDVVSQLAARASIPFKTCAISEAELRSAQEVFIGAATFGTLAVTSLDGRPIGTGEPGPIWRRIRALFEDYKRELATKPIEES